MHLLRHAKSSWADADLDDHERPLADRGVKAVKRLRRHIKSAYIAPALVLCSSARRALMTLEGIARALPEDVVTSVDDDLYGASAEGLLESLRTVADHVPAVMLIGHNPGLADLATMLIGAGDDTLRHKLNAKFPTGALATLHFRGGWSDLAPGSATLDAFVLPRELA